MKKTAKVCATCGVVGEPVGFGSVEVVLALFLLFLGILPGIIYAIFVDYRAKACASCGARIMIPVDSPRGREIAVRAAGV
ncbi:MAG: hypothetical protein NDJ92_18585 [Thermoanaerobaculia bacterium]|nr:hypothetical protein [Thermoanaerobaculia bacterium]